MKGGGFTDRVKTRNPLDELKIDMTTRQASPKEKDHPQFGNIILAQEIAKSAAYQDVGAFSMMKIEKGN